MLKKEAVIIDYGCGNLTSIKRALEYLNFSAIITNNPDRISKADRLILPGVGNFGFAMNAINKLNLKDPIIKFISSQKPFLGICLGMQLMFQSSEEDSHKEKGLSIFTGSVEKIPINKGASVPRVGWYNLSNQDSELLNNKIFTNISFGDKFYFVHSYKIFSEEISSQCLFNKYFDTSICTTVIKDNIYLFQFHPEKSSHKGLEIYKNFFSI